MWSTPEEGGSARRLSTAACSGGCRSPCVAACLPPALPALQRTTLMHDVNAHTHTHARKFSPLYFLPRCRRPSVAARPSAPFSDSRLAPKTSTVTTPAVRAGGVRHRQGGRRHAGSGGCRTVEGDGRRRAACSVAALHASPSRALAAPYFCHRYSQPIQQALAKVGGRHGRCSAPTRQAVASGRSGCLPALRASRPRGPICCAAVPLTPARRRRSPPPPLAATACRESLPARSSTAGRAPLDWHSS